MNVSGVRNPLTGRMITVGGDTYNRLIAQGYVYFNGSLLPPAQLIPTVNTPSLSSFTPISIPKLTPSRPISRPVIAVPKLAPLPPANIGSISDFEREIKQIEKDEENKRLRLCTSCRELYIDRFKPFTAAELKNLQLIIKTCEECGKLCQAHAYRQAGVKSPACNKYEVAAASGKKQLDRLDTELRIKGINTATAAGQDISPYFPK